MLADDAKHLPRRFAAAHRACGITVVAALSGPEPLLQGLVDRPLTSVAQLSGDPRSERLARRPLRKGEDEERRR